MTSGRYDLQLEVVNDQIIVALIGTAYGVVYSKRDSDPQLYAKDYPIQVDPRSGMSQAEFLAKAWKLANDKARELGWIV
jgi:hypothetical protein